MARQVNRELRCQCGKKQGEIAETEGRIKLELQCRGCKTINRYVITSDSISVQAVATKKAPALAG